MYYKPTLLTKALARKIETGETLSELIEKYQLTKLEQLELEEFIKETNA